MWLTGELLPIVLPRDRHRSRLAFFTESLKPSTLSRASLYLCFRVSGSPVSFFSFPRLVTLRLESKCLPHFLSFGLCRFSHGGSIFRAFATVARASCAS